MGHTVIAALLGIVVPGLRPACSVSPARVEQIQRAWDERDAERARGCERVGRRFVTDGCGGGGGP